MTHRSLVEFTKSSITPPSAFPWPSFGYPVAFLRLSRGLPSAIPWPSFGPSLAFPWPSFGPSLAFPWLSFGPSLAFPWLSCVDPAGLRAPATGSCTLRDTFFGHPASVYPGPTKILAHRAQVGGDVRRPSRHAKPATTKTPARTHGLGQSPSTMGGGRSSMIDPVPYGTPFSAILRRFTQAPRKPWPTGHRSAATSAARPDTPNLQPQKPQLGRLRRDSRP